MADTILENVSPEIKESSIGMLQWTKKKRRSTFGLSDKAYLACESLKQSWRAAHPRVVSFWAELEETVRRAILNPNVTYDCGLIKVRRQKAWLYLRLPSGRCLCYPAIKVGDDNVISYQGKNQYSRRWEKIRTYSGKLVENCIAEGTEVLTEKGWLAIEQVSASIKVWDGVEWVSHSGLSYNGVQSTIEAYGVTMTSDHLVLTEEGWKHARSCERFKRAESGLPYGYDLRRFAKEQSDLEHTMRLRKHDNHKSGKLYGHAKEGQKLLLRLFGVPLDEARNEQAPGLSQMAGYERPLLLGVERLLLPLRRSWDNCMSTLVRQFRQFLGGHERKLSEGLNAGSYRQRKRLFTGELSMGYGFRTSQQPLMHFMGGYSSGTYERGGRGQALRLNQASAIRKAKEQLADSESARPVYDLINCGPRNRFVVRGKDGLPLIVHNCCQGVARDVMAYNMPEIENKGYEILLTVHDELITEAPDTPEFNAEDLSTMLSASKPWSQGLPLASAGFEAHRYRKG